MIASTIYHAAVCLLIDIGEDDREDREMLQPALQHLKNKRLLALRHEHTKNEVEAPNKFQNQLTSTTS